MPVSRVTGNQLTMDKTRNIDSRTECYGSGNDCAHAAAKVDMWTQSSGQSLV